MKRFVATVAITIALLTLESVVVKYLGFSVTRIDVTVAVVAFLSLRASTLEGAFSSFVVGYLLDLMSGRPTGLYTFLAVLTFLVGRLAASLVDVRSALVFVIFTMAADLGHGLLAIFFSWLTSRDAAFGSTLSALPTQVALTGAAALALYPLFRKFDSSSERSEVGLLR
jgi:rod shape-determining protein MreD